ncbi:MAG: LEA type 2 family protein [Flavitalea sp.]
MTRVIGFVMILGVIGSCTKPQDLTFIDVQNFRMLSFGFTETKVGLDVRFYNPNNQRVQLKDAAVKVYANSTYLGDTNMDSVVSIPKKDTFSVPLILKIQTVTAITNVLQTLSDTTVAIRVEGNVKMGKGGVFINYPINYTRQQRVKDLKF